MPQPSSHQPPKVFPVIHFIDSDTAFDEAQKVVDVGADGVFLISHHGDDSELLSVACAIQARHPRLPVGVNFLSWPAVDAVTIAALVRLPMLWGDDVGVDSTGLNNMGLAVQAQDRSRIDVFASVAFKYRPHEPNPALAAKNALQAGFIPTTSGSQTGAAPDLDKIIAMSRATQGVLAVASGMTPDNVADYAPHVSHILVATGVALDGYHLDVNKLSRLIARARQSAAVGLGTLG